MNVIVTGAGGFVGRHLVKALLEKGLDDSGQPIGRLVHFDRAPSAMKDDRIVEVVGDIADPISRARALAGGGDCIFHLAAVPGGTAEYDPGLSHRVNVDATLALANDAAALNARFVYASTIAVLGTPSVAVDDATEPRPVIVYGVHKRQVEIALEGLFSAGALRCSAVRLPGIVARPRGASGLKSAFLSEIFHACAAGEPFVCPVSPEATVWLMSARMAASNLIHASRSSVIDALAGRAVTLPALRTSMAGLAAALSKACALKPDTVTYAADEALEAVFGRLPPLSTERAIWGQFADDCTLERLVKTVLEDIRQTGGDLCSNRSKTADIMDKFAGQP